MLSFKLSLKSGYQAFVDLILYEPKDMGDLMDELNQHHKLDEAIVECEKSEQKNFTLEHPIMVRVALTEKKSK